MTVQQSRVLELFKELASIPHCSYKEEAIGDYLIKFAEQHQLDHYQDEGGNVYIYRAATNGKADAPVILQGHMDMVCVKDESCQIDFEKDPLDLYEEEGFLKAKGTSLGADNGIAVAMILAILEDDSIQHPGIEAIITTREEVGLLGAAQVEGDRFKGKTLINIDSEEEGIFTVSCCGGVRHMIELPIEWTDNQYAKTYKLTLRGLKGGHSGMEIDQQRANGIKLMARVLHALDNCALVEINGGEAMNAIAKDIDVILASDRDIAPAIAELQDMLLNEYRETDEALKLSLSELDKAPKTMTQTSATRLIDLLLVLPYGVIRMSDVMPDLVETSSNIGIITTSESQVAIDCSHRSSVESAKQALIAKTNSAARLAGATTHTIGDYPGWQYVEDSPIRQHFSDLYSEIFNEAPVIAAIHAGLECGILQEQIGQLDMISIGPNIYDVHTPNERLDLASTSRTYQLLVRALQEL